MPATLTSSETELGQRYILLVKASVCDLKLVYCWARFVDTGATLNQHQLNISCVREVDLLSRDNAVVV